MGKNQPTNKKKLPLIGWREWVSLPELGIHRIKAKIDTGARTSALHAFAIIPFKEGGKDRIRFELHPEQHNMEKVVTCVADLLEKRKVTDSGGHTEERYVIETLLTIDQVSWPIQITLTERDSMLFRMLLGRNAIKKRFMINPARSFILSKKQII